MATCQSSIAYFTAEYHRPLRQSLRGASAKLQTEFLAGRQHRLSKHIKSSSVSLLHCELWSYSLFFWSSILVSTTSVILSARKLGTLHEGGTSCSSFARSFDEAVVHNDALSGDSSANLKNAQNNYKLWLSYSMCEHFTRYVSHCVSQNHARLWLHKAEIIIR